MKENERTPQELSVSIANLLTESVRRGREYGKNDPQVLLFSKEEAAIFEETGQELVKQDYQLMDVNECAGISPEDDLISAKEAGFAAPESVKINDLQMSDEEKRRYITRVKLNRLLSQVNDRSILIVKYNDLYTRGGRLYETVRTWLKDGYSHTDGFPSVVALVLVEKEEGIQDFCQYGSWATDLLR